MQGRTIAVAIVAAVGVSLFLFKAADRGITVWSYYEGELHKINSIKVKGQ